MKIKKASDILEFCKEENTSISECMIRYESDDSGSSREEILARTLNVWYVMKSGAKRAFLQPERIDLKITQNDALKLHRAIGGGGAILSTLLAKGMCYALSSSALNSSMGRIAACPTAGSCGIVPGTLLAVQEENGFSDEMMALALLNSSGIGLVVAEMATLAGALGGCQAEVGTACAMASSALVELLGGSPDACMNAAALALKSLMGLVCDTVASLVESPCAKRNASGVGVAFSCAQMALCGIRSIIPIDEVIIAMSQVGALLPASLKETLLGGIAATPTGGELSKKIRLAGKG